MEKERSKNLTSKVDFYFTILEHIKNLENLSEVSKELNISKQKLNYHTTVLKKLGFIEKESYGKWKVKRSQKKDLEHALNWKDKKIRGHAFIWKVKPSRNYDWKLLLEKNNINYKLVRGYTPRIFVKNQKIWLAKDSIVIYDARSFYGKNAVESRKYAVFGLQETIKELKRILGIEFDYYFRPTREHFGMIKNELARQCNEKKEKIIVRDTLDGEWLWVDNSKGMLGELETGGKGFTKDRAKLNMEVQNWYNSHKKTDFKVTPEFVLNTMNGIQQNQLIFDQNMKSHLEVLDKLGKAVNELRKEIKNLSNKK
jgi:DNA-binding transcriptional ArsR family regulator